jgi:hypothetical protein
MVDLNAESGDIVNLTIIHAGEKVADAAATFLPSGKGEIKPLVPRGRL